MNKIPSYADRYGRVSVGQLLAHEPGLSTLEMIDWCDRIGICGRIAVLQHSTTRVSVTLDGEELMFNDNSGVISVTYAGAPVRNPYTIKRRLMK